MSRRPIAPLEYLQIGRRRWIWIVIPTLVFSAGTYAVGRKLPKVYSSEALILVDPQRVPTDFVKPTVSSNVADRLESIREQILSRTQLDQIIQKYGLYHGQKLTEDGQVTQMLSDIHVKPMTVGQSDSPNAQITAFSITYDGRDPVLTQQVTRELSNLFISENLNARAQQAEGTEQFIDDRVTQASQQLDTLENQLKDLKSEYMGSLPEQQGANLTVMGQLQTVLQTNADAIARAQQQRTYLTSLGQAVNNLSPSGAFGTPAPDPLETQLQNAQTELATAEQLYTPRHPDVIRLQAQVKALTEQIAAKKAQQAPAAAAVAAPAAGNANLAKAAPGDAGTASAKPAAAATTTAAAVTGANSADLASLPSDVRSQIEVIDQEIKLRTKDQAETQAKIAGLQARIERGPEVEEKLADLTNSYNVAKANYTTLLEKKDAAAMGSAMEQQADGEGFRVVDPANLPQKPSSPDLARIDMMGSLAGLLLGLSAAFLVEMRDQVARCEADLTFYAQAPMLAALPLLPQKTPAAAMVLTLSSRGRS